MSFLSLAERIRANRTSRSPVQDTVEELFEEISATLARGGSFRTIHKQLLREGHNVGRGHTSLFAAFKKVEAYRGGITVPAQTAAKQSVPSFVTPSVSAPTLGEMPTAVIDSRRKTTDW